jgi:hypothetical protein
LSKREVLIASTTGLLTDSRLGQRGPTRGFHNQRSMCAETLWRCEEGMVDMT